MQKNIILSMHQPFWLMIAMGRKKLELRTTKPKGDIPFKVYVYVTGGVGIVGEFVCNNVQEIHTVDDCVKAEKPSCVKANSIFAYTQYGKRKIYAWNISNVKVYRKPLMVSEFGLKRAPQTWQYMEEAN